jgi:ribosomal protein S16
MLRIKLAKNGRKKRIIYSIFVSKGLATANGKSICNIGSYSPVEKKAKLNLYLCKQYLDNGAVPTATIRHLLTRILLEL